jgi:ABC-type Zn uptake system ZnuABC Zn-binding protein ZnuA
MRTLPVAAGLLLGFAAVRADDRPVVVVTTSLIATAVRDIAGDAVDVETLMPAGTCPGQFDLEPQQVRRARAAVLIIRHEMQEFLNSRFAAAGLHPGDVIAPSFGGPFTVPDNYARFCETVAAELVRRVPAVGETARARLPAIRERARKETARLRSEAAPLAGTKVVAAAFQVDFLRWLGLEVVAVFPPNDDPPPRALREAIAAGQARGAMLVVGNEQNGRRVPAAIAEALGIRLVMLSNFPERDAAGSFWELERANVEALRAGRVQPALPDHAKTP